jgi:hypothetical protein
LTNRLIESNYFFLLIIIGIYVKLPSNRALLY